MFSWVPFYLKALIGAGIAALSSIQATLQNGNLTTLSYVSAALAGFIAFGAIAATPNGTKDTPDPPK